MNAPPRFRRSADESTPTTGELEGLAKHTANARTLIAAVGAVLMLGAGGAFAWTKLATKEEVRAVEARMGGVEQRQAATEAVLPLILETVKRIEERQIEALKE